MSKGTRLINYLIDLFFIALMTEVISALFENQGLNRNVLIISIYFTYYLLFEYFKGQTIGKMITKTVVIDLNDVEPNFFKILFRTLLRFSAIDPISYLFGFDFGIHDTLSQTKLKYKNK
jgi:uncharacterized RDD family membrane protein YckC